MKKDIEVPLVDQIAFAVVHEENEDAEMVWNTYLINLKKKELEGVLVSSKGYGKLNGEDKKTSVLRHFLNELPGERFIKVERIIEEVFGLTNEYWVSFRQDKIMYDKKYVFVPESIKAENCIQVPLIGRPGVMIK
jgi:hypothetical protein